MFPDRRIKRLTDYPNSRFFMGIDGALTATGYNTVHELSYFNVPSIYVPDNFGSKR